MLTMARKPACSHSANARKSSAAQKKTPPRYAEKGVPSSTYSPPWQASPGLYIAGKEEIDPVDQLGVDMDLKWGVGRLRIMIAADNPELANKFDRQRYLYSQAKQTGQLEDVRREARRMQNAWMALDRAAEAAGKPKADPAIWEVSIPCGSLTGSVAVIVKDPTHYQKVVSDGRHKLVYSLEEIGRLIGANELVSLIKEAFPGAKVEAAIRPKDPIQPSLMKGEDGIPDISAPIDAVIGVMHDGRQVDEIEEPNWNPPGTKAAEDMDDDIPF
jgi:hypothetical protein